MPVSEDIGVLNTQIDQLIHTSRLAFTDYVATKRANEAVLEQRIRSNTLLAEKESNLRELDRLTSTYEQEFLDRQKHPKPKSFFGRLGLLSVQDWVLALYFFSYAVFFIMVFVLAMKYSTQRLRAGAALFILFLIVGYGSTAAILLLG